MQSLGAYALNRRNLPLAHEYFKAYAQHCETHARRQEAAGAYHQLGRVAEERRDFAAAEARYRKALKVLSDRVTSSARRSPITSSAI